MRSSVARNREVPKVSTRPMATSIPRHIRKGVDPVGVEQSGQCPIAIPSPSGNASTISKRTRTTMPTFRAMRATIAPSAAQSGAPETCLGPLGACWGIRAIRCPSALVEARVAFRTSDTDLDQS